MTFANLFAPSVAAIRGNSLSFQTIGENIANAVTAGFKTADTASSKCCRPTPRRKPKASAESGR